ncbi:hypothetical protein PghCCS26_15060 [Paenibacillus glycanilyticus]|uniref:DUF4321 domain-containing protein n=1 Tax=Paenibacillus glycanilyticus TaxID=126569 RepID=A0ABQ6NIK3_9BACL|nr:hypothetical protein PghCCS26_15060 [Paenibacillus glycanilyticus]
MKRNKNQKDIMVANILLFAAMFVACRSLYGNLKTLLDVIHNFNFEIKNVTYSYCVLTVHTDFKTIRFDLLAPLLVATIGILINVVNLLFYYSKGNSKDR